MEKKEFKTQSKKILDLMINSIYTNKDIFLRELISNASDSIDKVYYKTLTDEKLNFNKEDYFIRIDIDKKNRKLIIQDTGIGMSKEELEENLGTIAKSGSLDFKENTKLEEDKNIIGQFGVGFYSAFMVANKVKVESKAYGCNDGFSWESEGADGYIIEEILKEIPFGTKITLSIKENDDDFNYDNYLEEYYIKNLIKKYSDFIRYPIIMKVTKSKPIDDKENEFEEVNEDEVINSMVPIWRKNKGELAEEDYHNFFEEKHFGFGKPLKYIHMKIDGQVRFSSILYIPSMLPFNYFSKDYKKGLKLYSNGVLIMDKYEDLLPDHFGFVVGVVDCDDLPLNISRETIQKSKHISLIAKKIKDKITSELELMLKNERETYEKFYDVFSRNLKFGLYDNFGQFKDELASLLLFKTSFEDKYETFSAYISRIKDDQEKIYYMAGDDINQIKRMPQVELLLKKGYELIYLTEDVDEFAIKSMHEFNGKHFESASDSNIELGDENLTKEKQEESKDMLIKMKEILTGEVDDVILSKRLITSPVCITSAGELSTQMEKTLNKIPSGNDVKSKKILELNPNGKIFDKLSKLYEEKSEKFEIMTRVLFDQALMIEGLSVKDPLLLAQNISLLIE